MTTSASSNPPPQLIMEDYVLLQPTTESALEIWADWTPQDGGVVRAQQQGKALVLLGQGQVRRLELSEDYWEILRARGGELVLCGPSGVLGRARFTVSQEQ